MRWWFLFALLSGCVTSTHAPSPEPSAEAPGLGRLGRLVHRAANQARQTEGIAAVAWSDELATVAAGHSRDMAERGFFSHDTPDGVTAQDRAQAGGIDCRVRVGGGRTLVGVSENLYTSTRYHSRRTRRSGDRETVTVDWFTPDQLADRTIRSWLSSPGHRRNLLKSTVSAHGIGVATDNNDRVYVTQVLC